MLSWAMGSQGVAALWRVPANGVAIGSQSGDLPSLGDPVTGPLTSGVGGAPRGIRTPNRQIRGQPSPVPAGPSYPFPSPLVLVNGHNADPIRVSVPARHVRHGCNVVAVSGHRRQTGSLATRRVADRTAVEHQILDLVLYFATVEWTGVSPRMLDCTIGCN
jgi:hypothetical protein